MEDELKETVIALCEEVELLADSHRNVSMKEFVNTPEIRRLRELVGMESFV